MSDRWHILVLLTEVRLKALSGSGHVIILAFCLDPMNGATCANGPFLTGLLKGPLIFRPLTQISLVSGFLESSLGALVEGLKGYISGGVEVIASISTALPVPSPPQTLECVLGTPGERTQAGRATSHLDVSLDTWAAADSLGSRVGIWHLRCPHAVVGMALMVQQRIC